MMKKAERAALVADAKRQINALKIPWTDDIRAIRKKFTTKLKTATGADVIAIGQDFVAAKPRWFGYELIHHHREAMTLLDIKTVEALGKGIGSWDQVDTFGIYIAGPAWLTG
jgi:hypothetical protein